MLGDLGLSRRPLLEPNLNASGLLCLSVGVLGLLLAETVSLPVEEGAAPEPGRAVGREDRASAAAAPAKPRSELPPAIDKIKKSPCLPPLKHQQPQVIVARVLASLAHLALVVGAARDRLAALRAAVDRASRWPRVTCCCPTRGWRWSIAASSSRRP